MSTMNNHWPGFRITDEDLEAKTEWLSRDDPRFQGPMVMFFRTAASLLRFTRQVFTLLPLVFVQTVIGLEQVLRLVCEDPKHKRSLSELLKQAASDGHLAGLEKIEWMPFPASMEEEGKIIQSRADVEDLAALIPNVRNELLHGEFALTFEFLALALHVRRLVDALMPHLPSFIEQNEAAFAEEEAQS